MPRRRQLEFPIHFDNSRSSATIRIPDLRAIVHHRQPPLTRRFSMITTQHVQKLCHLDRQGIAKEVAAARVGMDAKTARKYRRLGKLPSEVMVMDRNWRTRPDVFAEVLPELEAKLQVSPALEARTLFVDLQ